MVDYCGWLQRKVGLSTSLLEFVLIGGRLNDDLCLLLSFLELFVLLFELVQVHGQLFTERLGVVHLRNE
ncbi:hypothetical protein BpHYR1_047927 [Brachionus plicatilis]|uniref:Uncharacterized protein n=1 Tax=Brachionus plicatilis TaxID=10195 RepID=A0A3M7RL36_BRAPC|nr:hypothetical protein BpHYR1_047927 [Brachionus plicatilis]